MMGTKWRPKYNLPSPFKELPFIGVPEIYTNTFITDYIEGNYNVLRFVAIANPLIKQNNGDLFCNWGQYPNNPNGGKLLNNNNGQQYAYNKGTGTRTLTRSYLDKCIKIQATYDKLRGEVSLDNGVEIINTQDEIIRLVSPYVLFGRFSDTTEASRTYRGHFIGLQVWEDNFLAAQFVPCAVGNTVYIYNIVTGFNAPFYEGVIPSYRDYDMYIDYDF